MKAYQFLKKFHYVASSINHVLISDSLDGCVELYVSEVADPTNKESYHRELLEKNVNGFRIKEDNLFIFVK